MRIQYLFTATVILGLAGCAGVPTTEDAPVPLTVLRNSAATIWVYPRNPRVNLERLASNDFEFSLPKFPASKPQDGETESDWCWAYCASQVLRYNGTKTTPSQLVAELRQRRKSNAKFGDAGTIIDIVRPLIGSGRFVGMYTPDMARIAQDITFDSPVILALEPEDKTKNGHAVVLVGIRFSFYYNKVLPSELTIYDPEKGLVEEIEADAISSRIRWAIHFRDYRRY